MDNISKYISERFPVVPALLFSLGLSALATGVFTLTNIWANNLQQTVIVFFSLTDVFFFFLLKQRVIDEFRDAQHDNKNFPDRPIPRGLITKKQLIFIGIFALLMELLSVIFTKQPLYYLPVIIYTFLMAKEFFLKKWLDSHFTIYFLIHEIIFLLFGLFFIKVLLINVLYPDIRLILGLSTIIAMPVGIEIIRKFKPRYDRTGKVVQDTYGTVWGRENTIMILVSLIFYIGLALTIIKTSYIFFGYSLFVIILLLLVRKTDKYIVLTGIVGFLGLAIMSNLLW